METLMRFMERGVPGVFVGGIAGALGGMLTLARYGTYWQTELAAVLGLYVGLVTGGVIGGIISVKVGGIIRRIWEKYHGTD